MDEEWMAGVSINPEQSGEYIAFIMNHLEGQYVAYHVCSSLAEALDLVNQVQRGWKYESSSTCGGCVAGKCESGTCSKALQL